MSEKKNGGTIVHDPDLKAMNAISKAMAPLSERDAAEVVAWFKRKYDAKPENGQ